MLSLAQLDSLNHLEDWRLLLEDDRDFFSFMGSYYAKYKPFSLDLSHLCDFHDEGTTS